MQTVPPSQVPQPIPRLKMPEKMDMATAEAASEEAFMVSDWKATLKAVAQMPQSTHRAITAQELTLAGDKSRSESVMPKRAICIKE